MIRFLLIALLAFTASGHASITAAWKVPIKSFAPDHEHNDKVLKLEKPPGESAFFQAGDELWDVSKAVDWLIYQPQSLDDPFGVPDEKSLGFEWHGDWLVWNARSGMMIASGSWNDLLLAEEVLRFNKMPIVVRTRVDLVAGGDEAAGQQSVDLVSRGGEKASIALNHLKLGVEARLASRSSGLIDASFEISWPADVPDSHWEIVTAVTLDDGKRLRVARQGGWELFVTVTSELVDGTPLKDGRWQETKEGVTRWLQVEAPFLRMRKALDQRRLLGIYRLPPDLLLQQFSDAGTKKLSDLPAPAEISEWVRGPLGNVRDFLGKQGLKLGGEETFAGFNPVSRGVFIIADEATQDLAEQLFSVLGPCCGEPPVWIETNPEAGAWGLAARSGEHARISRIRAQETNLTFDIEPIRGADGVTFDLHYTLNVVSSGKSVGKLESKTTLLKDEPQVIGFGSTARGDQVKVIVTASDPRE